MYKVFLWTLMFCVLIVSACDLQPKIASIPDSIGMFIENRYPALLADPETQPEIYNSAVTDYGVYASPELYGSGNIDDYVLYASIDDYVLVPEPESDTEIKTETDVESETEPEIEQKSETEIEEEVEQEIMTDYIIVPMYGGNTIVDETPVVTDEKKVTEEPKTKEKPIEKQETKQNVEPTEKRIEKQEEKPQENPDEIIVVRGDTVYALAKKHNMSVDEFAKINNLSAPYTLKIGQKLTTRVSTPVVQKTPQTPVAVKETAAVVEVKKEKPKETPKEIPNVISKEKVQQIKAERVAASKPVSKPTDTKRVDLTEITVVPGDTLYSISRKYEIPVNDLAVMNKMTAPFSLSVGQKLKVPKLDKQKTKPVSEIKAENKKATAKKASEKITDKKPQEKTADKKANTKTQTTQKNKPVENKVIEKPKPKVSVNRDNKPSKIIARSSSKFSWPVRGTILSGYGPKKGGLVNDGINISASSGTSVKAAENGVVAYAGNEIKGMGNLIIIQHSDGWMTVYAHLNSMNVKRGTKVLVGQNIGTVGKTGKVDKPQLHFEIRKGTKSYNPTSYLKK